MGRASGQSEQGKFSKVSHIDRTEGTVLWLRQTPKLSCYWSTPIPLSVGHGSFECHGTARTFTFISTAGAVIRKMVNIRNILNLPVIYVILVIFLDYNTGTVVFVIFLDLDTGAVVLVVVILEFVVR